MLIKFDIRSYILCVFNIILSSILAVSANAAEQLPSALKVTGTWSFELNGSDAELSLWIIPSPYPSNRAKLQGALLIDEGRCQMGINLTRSSYPHRSFSNVIKDPRKASRLDALGNVFYNFEKIQKYNYYKVSCEPYLTQNTSLMLFVLPDGTLKVSQMPYVEEGRSGQYLLESISDLHRSSASMLMREILSIGTEENTSFLSKLYYTDPALKIEIPPSDVLLFPTQDVAEVLFEKSVNQSSINNFSPQYVLNDYKAEIDKRGWWKVESREQPNNGYAYEIISLNSKLNLKPETSLLPEISGIDWSSLKPEPIFPQREPLDENEVKKRIKATRAFLSWYDSPEKGNSSMADVAPIINNISNWHLVSNFGVQYIEPRRSTVLGATNRLLKEIDMSATFEFGERTGHMSWDRDQQYIRAQPTAKNTITGVIENVVVEPFQEIHFLYDAALSKRLGTPAYTSSKILFTRDELCLEWASDINVAQCTNSISATPMKNRTFTLIEDKDIATSYYYNLVGKPQSVQDKDKNRDKCADEPFCEQLEHEYLQNIFRGNYSAVRRADLKTRDELRGGLLRGQLKENPIFNQWIDALVPYAISNLRVVLDRYLLAYKKHPDSCFPGGRQRITIAKQTDKFEMVDGFGTPTGETFGGEIISSVYEVPPHLVPYVNSLGSASTEGSKTTLSFLNKYVTGTDTSNMAAPLDTLPGKIDCQNEKFAAFESNLIAFYERLSNEPSNQPLGSFVRSYE